MSDGNLSGTRLAAIIIAAVAAGVLLAGVLRVGPGAAIRIVLAVMVVAAVAFYLLRFGGRWPAVVQREITIHKPIEVK
ncbi:MAG: hypothetical protein ACRDGN_09260, partial [bacterium]